MKRVLAEIARRTEEFAQRPFFELMQGDGTLSDVRTLVPNLTFFVFSFQDLLRMNERQIEDPKLRELAKVHRREDAGHELWFLADMKKLGVERDIGWVLGRPHRAVRECSFEMVAEAIRAENDYTRITLPLVLESTGDVFFNGIFHFCDRVGVEQSLEYFSKPHWEVEVGHEIFGAEPQAHLESIVLEDATRDRLLASVERMFVSLGNLIDHLHACIVSDRAHDRARAS
jgi:hypothetical protein